jgi:hypothetical protein
MLIKMNCSCRSIFPRLLLGLATAVFPSVGISNSTLPSLGVVTNSGFCPNGVWDGTRWPGGEQPVGLTLWGSYCTGADHDLGRIELQEFLAPPALNLYLTGYPGLRGLRLILKNVQSGQETDLQPPSVPGDEWRFNTLVVPSDWVGKPVQLIAEDKTSEPRGWLGFSLPFLPATSLSVPAIDTTAPEGGFCADGVYPTTKWPDSVRPSGVVTWGSYCKSGDAGTGWMASQPVMAGSYLSIYVAGYPANAGLRLVVENMQVGRQLLIQIPTPPMETWRLYRFRLPDEWRGQSVRVVAADQATGVCGWVGFSDPLSMGLKADASSATNTLSLVLLLGFFLLLPPAAACMLAETRGITDLLELTTIAFLALGFTGYAAFWIYFASRIAGICFSYASLLTSCSIIVYLIAAKSRRSSMRAVKQMIAPATLVVLASIFIISLGLMHGAGTTPLLLAGNRFGPPLLARDNAIPKMFADAVYVGKIPKPLMADWLSSDRPPLQTGNTLWTYPWTSGNRDLPYLALAVILQCSFLAALWNFLTVCNVNRKPMALALATCIFSGFAFLNGFFTWPKLYPTGFLLIAVSYLLTGRYYQVRHRMTIGAMVGSAAAFAILCHGGSILALMAIAAAMLLLRRFPGRRFLLGMAVAVLLLYTPWVLYQKLYDPPGDRLLRWHLAGVVSPEPHGSFTSLLFNRYGELQSGELLQLKVSNFQNIAGNLPKFLGDAGEFGEALVTGSSSTRDAAAALIRRTMFLHWIPNIGLAFLGPLVLLVWSFSHRRRGTEFVVATRMWLLTGLTLTIWSLVLFGPVGTIPHQGTYLTELLALAGSCLAFWAVHPWLCAGMTAAQVLWNALLFIWLTPAAPQIGVGAVSGPVNFFLAAACFLSSATIVFILGLFALRGVQAKKAL